MRKTMRAVCEHGISPYARLLLVYYCERANGDGVSWYANDTIMEDLDISRPSFYRARGELVAAGLLVDRPDGRKHEVQVYPDDSGQKMRLIQSKNETDSGQNLRQGQSNSETSESKIETAESKIETAYRCINSSRTVQELINELGKPTAKSQVLGTLAEAWKHLCAAVPALKPPRASLTPCGLPPAEERDLAHGFADAQAMGYQPSDVAALADWVKAGKIAMRASPRQWLCKNLCTALADAETWRKAGKPSASASRSPPRPDAVTTSKTKEVKITNDREGLRKLGIEVSDRVVHGKDPGSASDPGDATGF